MPIDLTIAFLGLLVVALGLFSRAIKGRLPLSDSLIALAVGIAVGPAGTGWLDLRALAEPGRILYEAARVTLAIGLMAIALRLPKNALWSHRFTLATLMLVIMPFMWLTTSALAWLILGMPVMVALLIGAILTPTDPVVASTIVTSQLAKDVLPERIRHTISAESGLNDGLAWIFVFLPILLIEKPLAGAMAEWLSRIVLLEVIGAIALGVLFGYLAGKLLEWAERRDLVEAEGFLAYTIALAFAALGGAAFLGTNEILAVFITGIAFDHVVDAGERAEESKVQETMNQFFAIPIFALLGLALPWGEWRALGWSGVAFAVAVLLLRRLPAVWMMRRQLRSLRSTHELLFFGWFGPIGVSALLYVLLAIKETGDGLLWPVATLVICSSVIAHGVTASGLTRRLGGEEAKS